MKARSQLQVLSDVVAYLAFLCNFFKEKQYQDDL